MTDNDQIQSEYTINHSETGEKICTVQITHEENADDGTKKGLAAIQAIQEGISLRCAHLKGANLLFNADLRNADLRGANLINADLRAADLPLSFLGAQVDNNTQLDRTRIWTNSGKLIEATPYAQNGYVGLDEGTSLAIQFAVARITPIPKTISLADAIAEHKLELQAEAAPAHEPSEP